MGEKQIHFRHHLSYLILFLTVILGLFQPPPQNSLSMNTCSPTGTLSFLENIVSIIPKAEAATSCGCDRNPDIVYSDVSGQYADAVNFMTEACIFQGYSQAGCTSLGIAWPCFGINRTIKRNEALFALTRYHLNIRKDWVLQTGDPQYFADYPPDPLNMTQYYQIQTARHYNFVLGQLCTAIYSPDPYPPGSWCIDPFTDWFFGFHGVVRNDPQSINGMYDFNNPSGVITRGGFAQAMYDYYMAVDDPVIQLACVNRPTPTASPTNTPTPTLTPSATPTPTPVLYAVSGTLIKDIVSENGVLEPGEAVYTGPFPASINYTGVKNGSVPVNLSNGQYAITGLPEGAYTITITTPSGYRKVYPTTVGYAVRTGPTCIGSLNPPTPGGCLNGNVINLNFGITDFIAWQQFSGFDMRFDRDYDTNIPNVPVCNPTLPYALTPSDPANKLKTTGISFVGVGSTFFAGLSYYNKANAHSWVAHESYAPQQKLKTSFDTLFNEAKKFGLTITTIPGIPGCVNPGNCNLNALTAGVYHAVGAGEITLTNTSTLSGNKHVVILADDTIRIHGKENVINDSTIAFIAKNNIIVDKSIGTPSNICPGAADLEGYFSAGKSFIIESQGGVCPHKNDKQLFIEGSVTVNANREGGEFDNRRDLCDDNNKPSVMIKKRLDFLINAPDFLKSQRLEFREIAP